MEDERTVRRRCLCPQLSIGSRQQCLDSLLKPVASVISPLLQLQVPEDSCSLPLGHVSIVHDLSLHHDPLAKAFTFCVLGPSCLGSHWPPKEGSSVPLQVRRMKELGLDLKAERLNDTWTLTAVSGPGGREILYKKP